MAGRLPGLFDSGFDALFPSPLVGEGGENERSEFEPGEGGAIIAKMIAPSISHASDPLTRFLAALETTLSHKGRGKRKRAVALSHKTKSPADVRRGFLVSVHQPA
jgi:hypothetical protein